MRSIPTVEVKKFIISMNKALGDFNTDIQKALLRLETGPKPDVKYNEQFAEIIQKIYDIKKPSGGFVPHIHSGNSKQVGDFPAFSLSQCRCKTVPKGEYKIHPTLGYEPYYIWMEKRRDGIMEAILRRAKTTHQIPREWWDEFNEVCDHINKIRNETE